MQVLKTSRMSMTIPIRRRIVEVDNVTDIDFAAHLHFLDVELH